MLRFTRLREGAGPLPSGTLRLRLTHEQRCRSRLAVMTDDGTAVAIVLPRGTALRDGAVLAGDGDELAVVEAAAQPLARIDAASPAQLLRIVYHLANRHVPVQLGEGAVWIERDPVLENLAANLGARIEPVEQPFEPEAGAYHDAGHAHGHGGAAADPAGGIGEQLSIAAHSGLGARR